MPKRLQRSRKKGWRKPDNAVIVDRTSRWGNPFKIKGDIIYADASHRRSVLDPWVYFSGPHNEDEIRNEVIDLYLRWITGAEFEGIVRPCAHTIEEIKTQLAGKNLICFCGLDHPCHADILLKLANGD